MFSSVVWYLRHYRTVFLSLILLTGLTVYMIATGPPLHAQLRYFSLPPLPNLPALASAAPAPIFACLNFTLPAQPAAAIDVPLLCSRQGLAPRPVPAVLLDAVLFSAEANMLFTRLVELEPVVDKFIVLESPMTFSGHSKPLLFQQSAHCFAPFEAKLLAASVDLPYREGTWAAEAFMRNHMATVASEYAEASLLQHRPLPPILLATSDLDEIPSREAMATAKYCQAPLPGVVSMANFYYNLRWKFKDVWHGTRLQVYPFTLTPEFLRHKGGSYVIEGGWHMSYFMTVSQIQTKLASFSHTEYNRWPYNTVEWIASAVEHGKSLFSELQLVKTECTLDAIPRIAAAIPAVRNWLCGSVV